MQAYRFGRKLKLPSTRAIKHEVLSRMLLDSLKAQDLKMAAVAKADTKLRVLEPMAKDAAVEPTQW